MQVSCLTRKPNMVAGAQGDTPEVGGWNLKSTRCRVPGLAKS